MSALHGSSGCIYRGLVGFQTLNVEDDHLVWNKKQSIDEAFSELERISRLVSRLDVIIDGVFIKTDHSVSASTLEKMWLQKREHG